ncbi:MAG: HDIG domain-containing metalloprotein [Candidatus Omnitrophota bacterium]
MKNKKFGHIAFRAFILIATFLGLLLIFGLGKKIYIEELPEGDVSLISIYSPFDFIYQGDVDEEKTKKFQTEAIRAVPETYIMNGQPALTLAPEAIPEELKDSLPKIYPLYEILAAKAILSNDDEASLLKEKKDKITIIGKTKGTERLVLLSDLLIQKDIPKILETEAAKIFESSKMRNQVVDLLLPKIQPNLKFDREATELRKIEAAKRVPLQYKQVEVKRGELIIGKGGRITKTYIAKLNKINEISKEARIKKEAIISICGIGLILLIFIITFLTFLKLYEKEFLLFNRNLLLLGLLSLLAQGLGKIINLSSLPSMIIPAAAFPMAIMLLLNNNRVAILFSVFLSLFLGLGLGFNLSMSIIFLLGSIVGIVSVLGIRRRAQILQAGLMVSLVNFFSVVGLGLYNNLNVEVFLNDGLIGILNGLLCAVMLMVILPIFEWIFGFITNISLLELSDFNQPLLREMILKAPGTYHHSLIVGNISEAAAEAIGANALLARVGAYYHDIGKIEKPEYFSENQTDDESKHDNLSPSMSKLIIVNHVKNGLELGQKFKLRNTIRDFVEQHHGTSLVYYFYRRALEELEQDEEVREEGFRYPGPRPQTKEIAIVLLADSVEAASRSIEEPTPQKIENVVHKIINNKFIDGQLDECDLTLKDLEKIAKTFIHILSATCHARIKYPDQEDGSQDKESAKKNSHKREENHRPNSIHTS